MSGRVFVVSGLSSRAVLLCGRRRRSFLGGHAAERDQQGCGYFAICHCEKCSHRPLNYREYNGRVYTMEQFYEHGTGRRSEEDPAAWREAITITAEPTYQVSRMAVPRSVPDDPAQTTALKRRHRAG